MYLVRGVLLKEIQLMTLRKIFVVLGLEDVGTQVQKLSNRVRQIRPKNWMMSYPSKTFKFKVNLSHP